MVCKFQAHPIPCRLGLCEILAWPTKQGRDQWFNYFSFAADLVWKQLKRSRSRNFSSACVHIVIASDTCAHNVVRGDLPDGVERIATID